MKFTKEQIIADMYNLQNNLSASLSAPSDKEQEFIVVVGGLPIDPEVVDGVVKVGKVRVNLPHLVTRFTYEKACEIAECAQDTKKGVSGYAVPWRDAVRYRIDEISRFLQKAGLPA